MVGVRFMLRAYFPKSPSKKSYNMMISNKIKLGGEIFLGRIGR